VTASVEALKTVSYIIQKKLRDSRVRYCAFVIKTGKLKQREGKCPLTLPAGLDKISTSGGKVIMSTPASIAA
jgi:hypothetical protein